MLQVKNLKIKIADKLLVSDVSFSIAKGEVFAVVGQSGSGKSLTAYTMLNLSKFLGNFDISGEVIFKDKSLLQLSEKDMRKIRGDKISMIFQDPMTSLNPLHRIGRQMEESIALHQNLSKKEMISRIEELFDQVELSALKTRLDAFPHELSGGQRQRVMIAMALANDPDIIIADEPTTALDVTIQKEILILLKKLRSERNLSIMLITHDLTTVANIADRIAVMHKGEIVEQGNASEVLKNPQHEYTKKLLSSVPHGSAVPYPVDAHEVLSVKDFSVNYSVGKTIFGKNNRFFTALDNFNMNLKRGQTIAVVGESGSGKSTFAKGVLKLVTSSGKILLKGKNISRLPEILFRPYRRKLQVIFQDPYSSLNPRMTVGDIIMEGVKAHKKHFRLNERQLRELIASTLEKMSLPAEYMARFPHQLSGGEKQRIGIARALILHPDIIVLDEPTSALDLITQSEILKILKDLQRDYGLAFIFISHDLRVVKSLSHYVIVLKNGKIVEEGTSEEIFSSPKEEYTKNLIDSAFLTAA